ncbi:MULTISPECIES: MqnA/MqnD/SBP family protein [Acidiplasma]|jgi:1,4-dihydroxy-6-naphthoate synthase|uniref:MqnA/MqnD/SBP family protein n=1 Tax=Acidiplasma TaxID=507753 RepID=UPI0005E2EEA6|nr:MULTISPECIES: MqnA/MqnD/SBP family protein [unclassified Acidiplasma]KJE48971.1 ABC transporter substrate-binding protein [Acidiplasma sp. MBA-1]WMT54393.1 MAG: MqnA/MqnD/SBP family protein [Acidiplasma sp.]
MEMIIAHTPDPDDAFMFYAMFEHKIKTSFEYRQVVKDIETLNKEAINNLYDVTAISANGYIRVSDKYDLTASGASFGINYGPIVVAKKQIDLKNAVIGQPGTYTSSFMLYRMFNDSREYKEIRFDQITNEILKGTIDAGILIHDEQLKFQDKGLIKILDLYDQWKAYAGDLPVPLGFNAIRKSLSLEDKLKYREDFENSIKYAFDHEDDAVKYAMKYSRYNDFELERKFIKMYVNELSIDFGERGKKALEMYYKKAAERKLISPFTPVIV